MSTPKLPDQNSIGKDLNPACYGAVVYRIARVKPKLPINWPLPFRRRPTVNPMPQHIYPRS